MSTPDVPGADGALGAGLTILERHERAPYPGEYPSQRLYLWAEAPR